ncbi:GIY-YIG nuclease family protein [Bradyrhizobium betae]|uniref:GIY-YIG nuclease family protein n=1 Tax=Bradyrhizobium betae TaxID=244734 RepID=UPI001FE174BB|nr:GIY-YIG nuclease family protein [Bradyrhizobium betae]
MTGRPSIPEAADGRRCYYVYILASRIGGTVYVGVTNDLIRRVAEHKLKLIESFTKDYDVVRLVYFEQFDDPENAIKREKRLKKWKRDWKIALIEKDNPDWNDLYPEIAGPP